MSLSLFRTCLPAFRLGFCNQLQSATSANFAKYAMGVPGPYGGNLQRVRLGADRCDHCPLDRPSCASMDSAPKMIGGVCVLSATARLPRTRTIADA
jgi:hypothetical protein